MKRLLILALLLGPAAPVLAGSNPQMTVDDGRFDEGEGLGSNAIWIVPSIMLALGGLWVTDKVIVARRRRRAKGE